MVETDYTAVLADTLSKLGKIGSEVERLEIEAAKLRQFFSATLNMLPDSERTGWIELFQNLTELAKANEKSLKDAIHNVLRQAYPTYLTAANVRDRLQAAGFDFSYYKSNPLASVSTTLRRFSDSEVESTQIEAVTAYRISEFYMRKLRALARKLADAPATPRLSPLAHGFVPGTTMDVTKKK